MFKFQFRPMIGSPRSTCTFYRPKGMDSLYAYKMIINVS